MMYQVVRVYAMCMSVCVCLCGVCVCCVCVSRNLSHTGMKGYIEIAKTGYKRVGPMGKGAVMVCISLLVKLNTPCHGYTQSAALIRSSGAQ